MELPPVFGTWMKRKRWAMEINVASVGSNDGIKPNRSVKGREPTRQQLQQV
jgi:hypothetical protein